MWTASARLQLPEIPHILLERALTGYEPQSMVRKARKVRGEEP
jgi:hypothetical protein